MWVWGNAGCGGMGRGRGCGHSGAGRGAVRRGVEAARAAGRWGPGRVETPPPPSPSPPAPCLWGLGAAYALGACAGKQIKCYRFGY